MDQSSISVPTISLGPYGQLLEQIQKRELYEHELRKNNTSVSYNESLEYELTKMFGELPDNKKPQCIDKQEIQIQPQTPETINAMYEYLLNSNKEEINDMFKLFDPDIINPLGRRYRKTDEMHIMKDYIRHMAKQEEELTKTNN